MDNSNTATDDSELPGIAFATLPTTGETIAIRHGERIYYRVGSSKTAEELNAIYGVSKAQANAMLACVLAGWETPSTDSKNYKSRRASA